MKQILVAIFTIVILLTITGCDEESDPPRGFTNGITATIAGGNGQYSRELPARTDVQCEIKTYPGITVVEMTAYTAKDEKWFIKFRWNPESDVSRIKISESTYNEITFTSEDIGNFRIASSDGALADETYIDIIELVEDEIITATFRGFIYRQGVTAQADTLKNGYMITKTFVKPN